MSSEPLTAEQFLADSRVAEARQLLQAALADAQRQMQASRPSQSGQAVKYQELLQEFSELRGGTLFYPYLGSGFGNGVFVELADGSVKYDMITGIGVHGFGHHAPFLLDAAIDAALEDTIQQGNLQQTTSSLTLSRELVRVATASGSQLQHCFLTTSGATANENALKLLFQARAPASRLLAFENCFAGRTLATSQITDRAKNRVGLPTVLPVDYVPFFDAADPQGSLPRTLDVLRGHLQRYPGAHAGMMMELIQGEGGYYAAPREFLVGLCQALRTAQVPIFFDEIQTFGRTSRAFAFQHFELEEFADVVTVGKLLQVCATLFSDRFVPQPGLISQTFTGSTSSIHAALRILQRLETPEFSGPQARQLQIQQRFARHFEQLQAKHPGCIAGPWGLGSMIAFTPLDGSAERTRRVLNALFAAGVLAFSAGGNPTRIRMLPPFGVVTDGQIDAVCDIIAQVLVEQNSTA
jgi:acetylornithine aminotransferase